MKSTKLKHLLELNLSILLISTAAVLVRYIDLDPTIISFWRGLLGFIVLGGFMLLKKTSFKIADPVAQRRLLFSSFLFGAHWLTYFYALQTAGIALGMLSLYTYPAITALLEPFYFKTKFNKRHLILALTVLIGLYIMLPDLNLASDSTKGLISGILSAFFYALRNLTMKSNSKKYSSTVLMFYQFLFIAVIFTPFLFYKNTEQTLDFLPYLIGLGIVTTAIGHTMFVQSLKNFAVSTASLIGSSQPVFGILMGVIFLNETPNTATIIGGAIILSTVIIESISLKKK
ncbi:DMT family transporter [Flavicella sediminum]|uniref:DMT family transporter n=1 Tax=Flavicella sediminum TaxID=2585141 RepID=UPI0011241EEA|nr:DMT family transporter [Flavicella sediminum]